MKKYLLICLAFQILATSSPSGQGMQTLLKMGTFFHHFVHHLACHQEKIGLLDFVELHYFDHNHHEAEHAEHENLPFQHDHHHEQNIAQQAPLFMAEPPTIVAFQKIEISQNQLIIRPQHWLSSLHAGDIWQPPKA
jgi:hypothetical protein